MMNKLENFLNTLVEGGKVQLDEYGLSYFFDNLDLAINLTRDKSSVCFLEMTSLEDNSLKDKCYFRIPCGNILNFLKIHTQLEKNNNARHWLIKDSHVAIDFKHIIDPLYSNLIQTIKDSPVESLQFRLFKIKLEKAISTSSDLPSKKPKIQ